MTDRQKIKRGIHSGEQGSASTSAAKRVKQAGTEEEENNESQSIFSSSACEKALQNSLVLQNIFKFLSYKNLQACRYVDLPIWSSEIEYSMSQRPLLSIEWEGSRNKSYTYTQRITMAKTFDRKKVLFKFTSISELIAELETCERGHEIWLKIRDVDLTSGNLKHLLRKFSDVICSLDLRHTSEYNISTSILQNLLSGLPNLIHLNFTTFMRSSETHNVEAWNPSILLPQVQILSFDHNYFRHFFDQEFLDSLFQILPNLKTVHRFPLERIETLNVDGGLNLASIKSVGVVTEPNRGDKLLRGLSQLANISLETRLQMAYLILKTQPESSHDFWKSYGKSLFSILQNNQNTLEYLLIEPFRQPQFLEYPEIKAVKKIRFYCARGGNQAKAKDIKFFRENFNVAKTFPNLVEVTFEAPRASLEDFLKLFPEDAFTKSYFLGVTSLNLKISRYEELQALKKVTTLFPDVTSLQMEMNVHKLNRDRLQILGQWPKLISLKLKLDVTTPAGCITVKNFLDPVFTGIPKCKELREHKEKLDIDLKIHRENGGISSFSELKELSLVFYYKQQAKNHKVVPLFSHVTPFYGFQSLPDLQVTYAVPWDEKDGDKIREMLNPIEEHVIFKPHYYEEPAYYQELI